MDSTHRRGRLRWYLILPFIVLGASLGIGTELLIGTFSVPACGIGDKLQMWLLPINAFFKAHPLATNAVLITTSAWFDFCCFLMMFRSLFGRSVGPYLKLALFIFSRQSLQLLVSLPLPPDIIWYDPGIPSFFVRYGISNDLYFSAHTGVSLLAAMELSSLKKRWLSILGYILFAYMVLTVISFQIHYTMDVYTAVLTVFLVTYLSNRWTPPINRFLNSLSKKNYTKHR
jgi:hypothetical protein